jgi:putative nucleotidyltransferase with HDIG domain
MFTQPFASAVRFTRRDALRLGIAATALVLVLTAILSIDLVPAAQLSVSVGDVAGTDIRAPRALSYQSDIQTTDLRQKARDAVPPQYDYSADTADAVATAQGQAFASLVAPIDDAFSSNLKPAQRKTLLENAVPRLSDSAKATLVDLTAVEWKKLRDESARVLDLIERAELRDSNLAVTQDGLAGRMTGTLSAAERDLGAELIGPLIVPNSSFSQDATDKARDKAADDVQPVMVTIQSDQVIVHGGDVVTPSVYEALQQFGLTEGRPDFARLAGWFVLSILLVALLLAWVWRFRPEVWHRNNVLLLVGLLIVVATFALKLSAGRSILPFFVPTAAVGMLLAILLDAGAATIVMAMLAVVAGATNGATLELAAYVFLGGLAGIVSIRRGDRLHVFVEAGISVAIINVLVVLTFSLLGQRTVDIRGAVELVAACLAGAGGSAVAAVGTFAVLGNLFDILTVFQLLELANPSQPLLRRLLMETPGTYHHSIMVGNLAERAAESIGADPLLARVAAYYHDIGKLANPLAFIENQAGAENVHDQLTPEESAQILKQHVADGIDIAYKNHLPKPLIAFIPQHHGTALMSYFFAKAREEAAAPFGGLATHDGKAAAGAIDKRRFRHAGPKPQSKEAAIIMLADGVEASVRSLAARDEPAIRAMVGRIIEERMTDGQFDECALTLGDVERIREAFVAQLLGMYHQRIAYPQNKIVELEARRAASGGGSGAS